MTRYNPREIEPKWQQIWDETEVYKADLNSDKPKYVAMSMFNYPSGDGIHIGHAMNYTISDVKARFKRQLGHESYHPVGWDSFGLPAENYAIKAGVSPQASMAKIIPNYHKQYKAMGWSNDWSKEIASHEPEYYKWSQWIFLQMYKNGLAYQDSRNQWWCEKCQTVLANEQVVDGKCWRHDGQNDLMVEKREVKQWFFKITDYADELLDAIDALDWSESVKLAQKNWIGKSVGAEIDFKVEGTEEKITVFTTRADTLFGATFVVLAPENELLKKIVAPEQQDEINNYIKESEKKTEVERQASKEKTGVFTGTYVINPANNEKVPIWVADYVLAGYGTGAIMAVPSHDERDKEFAKKFDLPQKMVVVQDFGQPAENEVEVTGAVVIGYNPETKKYLGLRSLSGNAWLCGGGINEGETYDECANRELMEETGYVADELTQLGPPVYSHYYNEIKDSYRRSYAPHYLAFISKEAAETTKEVHETFTSEWFDYDDLYAEIKKTGGGIDHWLDVLVRAKRYIEHGAEAIDDAYSGEGIITNSDEFNGVPSSLAREKIVSYLAEKGSAQEKVNYKMRDWSVSRQRYWGAPIPIINCSSCGNVLVAEEQLPVVLPELEDFQPSGDGRSALARATDWLNVDCPQCGGKAERETDTLDTFIDSSWYMYRYFDPHNDEKIFDSELAKKWEPIDFYNGADHATAHLLYARFIGRFFSKQGLIAEPEPFKQFLFNGKIMAADGTMFSKSLGNGVDPLEIIAQGYGADALRTYLMFAAPLDIWVKWDPQGVPGTYRFLNRIWTLTQEYLEAEEHDTDTSVQKELMASVHKMIKKTTEDIEDNKYNTAIAAIMTCVNELYKIKERSLYHNEVWKEALSGIVACVAPFAPHVADELWLLLGNGSTVQKDSWPKWDQKWLVTDTITLVIQVNGKVRAQLEVAADIEKDQAIEVSLNNGRIKELITEKEVVKTIYVPGKLVNIVVK